MATDTAGDISAVAVSSKTGLRVQQLHGDSMFLVPGVLSVEEAQRFIDAAEAAGFQHQGSRGPAHGEAFRDNGRTQVHDEALAARLWQRTGLEAVFRGVTVDGARPVGLNPNLRFYRYVQGQRFGKHIDDSVELGGGLFTLFTLLVYLSGAPSDPHGGDAADAAPSRSGGKRAARAGAGSAAKRTGAGAAAAGPPADAATTASAAAADTKRAVQPLVGGETVFYTGHGPRRRVVASVRPQAGLALLHLHGEERCLEHEALEVQRGAKYVLRSDVVFRRPA